MTVGSSGLAYAGCVDDQAEALKTFVANDPGSTRVTWRWIHRRVSYKSLPDRPVHASLTLMFHAGSSSCASPSLNPSKARRHRHTRSA